MKDNSGKVLLALLAGASAGIVAGLLMAPEAGTATRESWGKSLGKFGDDLNKILQDGLSKLDGLKGGGSSEADNTDRSGAEDALAGLGGSDKSNSNKGGSSRKASSGSSAADAGTVDGPNSASTATYSQGGGSAGTDAGAGGTTGGSGVGS